MALAAFAFASCPSRPDVPAVVAKPTVESRAEIAKVVGGAMHGVPVALADDALTRDSVLIIEPAIARDAQGVPLDGRERRPPQHFTLWMNGSRCVLVHEETHRRFTLKSATCAPKENATT